MDDREQQQGELQKLQEDLRTGSLSRRQFLDRVKILGLGFGAVTIGGGAAMAHTGSDAILQSTNPAIADIVEEGRELAADDMGDGLGDEGYIQTAQYRRYRRYGRGYRRYRRGYRRYSRGYRRYSRGYRRYGRGYGRAYRRYRRHHGFGGYGRYSRYSRW